MDKITRENEKRRADAEGAGQGTYRHDVVETWAACTVCGVPIRFRYDERGRRCGCLGVQWQIGAHGWRRLEP